MQFKNLALIGLFVVAASSLHAQTVFSAFDVGAGPADPHPNANTAAAAYAAAANLLGTNTVINYESAPLGNVVNLVVAPGVTQSGLDFFGVPQIIFNAPSFPPAPALGGYNTTLAGAKYTRIEGGIVTYTFASPINAFGAYFTGIQPDFFQDTITFNDGTPHTINIPGIGTAGGAAFAGFTDPGKFISSITITANDNFGADEIGIDDIRFSTAPSSVPEPGSIALFVGMALAGAGFIGRRKLARNKA